MDRYEFNLKIEQFKKLIEKKDYEVAAKIIDSIDLGRIKTVSLLTTIADVYEVTGQYAKAKNALVIAFDKSAMGRQIAYKLTALSAKLGQLDDAREFYDEYIEMSPNNPSRYLLEYEIAKAENKELPVLIGILEKYLAEDMDEKWTYVLAVLYHKAGMGTKCVEMCDTIILWFNGGKFVKRALELKMLYVPLTPEQQELLDGKKDDEMVKRMKYTEEAANTVIFTPVKKDDEQEGDENFEDAAKKYFEGDTESQSEESAGTTEEDPGTETTDTIEETTAPEIIEEADGFVMEKSVPQNVEFEDDALEDENSVLREETGDDSDVNKTDEVQHSEDDIAKSVNDVAENDNLMHTTEIDFKQIHVREIDVENKYNTINLQAEIAESMAAILGDGYNQMPEQHSGPTKELNAFDTAFYDAITPDREPKKPVVEQATPSRENDYIFYTSTDPINPLYELEGDGQIGFTAPEPKRDDDQLEGQLTIEDILAEYERMNQEKEAAKEVAADVEPEAEEIPVNVEPEIIEEIVVNPEPEIIEEVAETEEEAPDKEEIVNITEPEPWYKERHNKKVEASVDAAALRAMFEIEAEPVAEPETEPETEAEAVEDDGFEEKEAEEDFPINDIVIQEAVIDEVTTSNESEKVEEVTEEVTEEEPIEEQLAEPEEEKPAKKKKAFKVERDEPSKVDLKKELKGFISKYGALTGMDSGIIKVLETLVKDYDKNGTSKTNNVFITGKLGSGRTTMARDLLKLVNKIRHREGRKVAKTNAIILNQKGVKFALGSLEKVDVIVEKAGSLNPTSVKELLEVLNGYTEGMIVVLEDEKSTMEQMFAKYPKIKEAFNNVLSIKELTLKDWADYAESYAEEKGYTLADMATLALHAELDKIYANNHSISKDDVEEIMDEAMESANRGIGKFFKKLFKKNDDSKIVIKEEDFY